MYNLRNRSFVKEIDFSPGELTFLLRLSQALKVAKYAGVEVKRLEGKEIALIFEKTSTRTRSAFEVAAFDQGAHVTYLDPSGSQLGHKESVADTARPLRPTRQCSTANSRWLSRTLLACIRTTRPIGSSTRWSWPSTWRPVDGLATSFTSRLTSARVIGVVKHAAAPAPTTSRFCPANFGGVAMTSGIVMPAVIA